MTILYEDNHLLAVDKPAGMLVQGDQTGDKSLVDWGKEYIKKKYDKPGEVFLGVVHRLDRPVSGVVLLARTSKALSRMNKLFQEKHITKTYWAVVRERPPREEGHLIHWLTKDAKKNQARAYEQEKKNSKLAQLHYQLIAQIQGYYLLKVQPQTGRPHQIRVQLATMGCPVQGDLKYGYSTANEDASISLHAHSLSFLHPVKQEPLEIVAPLPKVPHWQRFTEISEA